MMGGPIAQVVKSVAVISLIEYLRPFLANTASSISPTFAPLIAQALIVYLELAAYSQGWVTVPASLGFGF